MHAIEFLYGNTWTTGDIYGQYPWGNNLAYVEWQTLDNGPVGSSGQIGPNPLLPVGTVLGFYDPAGFDQLQVKCLIANSSPTNYQAIALDNLFVQLTNRPPAPVIWDTLAGVEYRLVYTENLATGIWTAVIPPLPGGWVPGGGPLTFTDSGATGRPQRFYRIEAR